MSARTPDSIFYEDGRYYILRVSQYDGLFDPKQFAITPEMLHTGAYRGFVACYSVVDGTLRLSSLEIRAKDGIYPAINDSIPSFPDLEFADAEEREFFNTEIQTKDPSGKLVWRFDDSAVYREIETPMAYTGTLRIGQDADYKYYRAFIPGLLDWMYRKVLDLKFIDGRLESVTNLSDEMAKIRDQQPTAEEYFASQSRSVLLGDKKKTRSNIES
jgi:hypothetical protein